MPLFITLLLLPKGWLLLSWFGVVQLAVGVVLILTRRTKTFWAAISTGFLLGLSTWVTTPFIDQNIDNVSDMVRDALLLSELIFIPLILVGVYGIYSGIKGLVNKKQDAPMNVTTANMCNSQICCYSKNPLRLTRLLQGMLWISMITSICLLVVDIIDMTVFTGSNVPESPEIYVVLQGGLAILYTLGFMVTAVLFLMWIYRANVNCRGFGATDMKFSPGWSIGYYFIPVLHLYKPYGAMKEIWQVSTNPVTWAQEKGSPLLASWWALWLLSVICSWVSIRLSLQVDLADGAQIATAASMAANFVYGVLCVVAVRLVSAIIKKQNALVT